MAPPLVLALLLAALLLPACSHVSGPATVTAVGFSGVWRLNRDRSDIPSVTKSQLLTIETDGDHVAMREVLVNDKDETLTIAVEGRFDGLDYPVSGTSFADTVSYRLLAPNVIEGIAKKGGRVVVRETAVLADDGLSVTVSYESFDGQGRSFTNHGVFERVAHRWATPVKAEPLQGGRRPSGSSGLGASRMAPAAQPRRAAGFASLAADARRQPPEEDPPQTQAHVSGMPSPRILLSAATHHPRHSVVADLAAAVNHCGWVVGFHPFSNAAVAVHFELPRGGLAGLSEALQRLPLHFSSDSEAILRSVATSDASSFPDPVPGSINVVFLHSEPDLRIPVPAVPG